MQVLKGFFAAALLALIALLLIAVVRSCGKEDEPPAPQIPPPPVAVPVQIDGYTAYVPPGPQRLPDVPDHLVDMVRKGSDMVSRLRLDKAKCVAKTAAQTGWKACLGDYLVAAVDETGRLQVVEVYGGVSTAPAGFSVTCEREGACDGGVNPPFIISAPPGWTAVAIRTAVFGDGEDGINAAVYVPYSTRLNTPELRQAGIEYLHDAMLAAYYELRAKDVHSELPGYHATDFGTVDNAITLVLTEQMLSDVPFERGTDQYRLEMLGRALVTFGLNRGNAYRYTRSHVGATGPMQLMPSSYARLHKAYPEANLPEDPKEGSIDHHTAIKASMLHTDSEWWAFRSDEEKAHRDFLLANPYERDLVFAAGYNANIKSRVDRAIHECGSAWREENCGKGCGVEGQECIDLPDESRRYLIKYEWIHGVIFDSAFRARVETGVWPTLYANDQAARTAYEERKAALAAAHATK